MFLPLDKVTSCLMLMYACDYLGAVRIPYLSSCLVLSYDHKICFVYEYCINRRDKSRLQQNRLFWLTSNIFFGTSTPLSVATYIRTWYSRGSYHSHHAIFHQVIQQIYLHRYVLVPVPSSEIFVISCFRWKYCLLLHLLFMI